MQNATVARIDLRCAVLAALLGLPVTVSGARAQPADSVAGPGTVVGTVLDADSGEPLPGAAVSIAPRPRGLLVGGGRSTDAFPSRDRTVLTGETGEYRFSDLGDGEYLLRITRLGYEPATLAVELSDEAPANVSVGLRVEPVRLSPLSVSGQVRNPYGRGQAAGQREAVTNRPAAVRLRQRRYLSSDVRSLTHGEVLEANTIGETDLFRALQRLPGVGTLDDWTALLRVRGARWDATRVYFDGLPLFNPLHVGTTLSGVNSDAVGTLFFHPGVRPPGLGGGGASVVEVSSRRPSRQQTRGYGELSLLSARLAVDRPLFGGDGGLMVAARRSYADLVLPTIIPDDEGGFPYAITDVTGRFDLDLGDSESIEASVLWERDDLFGDLADVTQGNRARWGNLATRLSYRHPLFGASSSHTLGLTRYGLDVGRAPPDPELDRQFNTVSFEPAESRIHHLFLRGRFEPADVDRPVTGWQAGYEIVGRSVRYDGPVPVVVPGLSTSGHLAYDSDLYRGALWGQYRWRPAEPLEVRAGLRLEAGEPVPNAGTIEPAPRLRLRYSVSPNVSVSAAAGRHFQFTQSMATRGGHPGSSMHPARGWRVAGERIPALRTDLITLGGEWWLGSQWLAGLSLYGRWGDGLLRPALEEGILQEPPPMVSGTESARGAEVSLRKVAGRWTLSASYSYGTADLSAAGPTRSSPSERRHLVDLTTMWRPASWFRIGGAYSAGSGSPLTRVFRYVVTTSGDRERVDGLARLGEPGGGRGPGYSRLDLLGEFTADLGALRMAVYLQVRNALGHENDRLYQGSRDCRGANDSTLGCSRLERGVDDRYEQGLPTVPLLGFRFAF